MTYHFSTLPLALAAALTACAAAPAATQSTGSTGDTAAASSSGPTTDQPTTGKPTTGQATTGQPTTGEASAGTASSEPTDSAATTEGAQSSSTGGTGDTTVAASTGEPSSTGADGELGPAALEAMQALAAAVAGVTYPSESDYPWVVVGFAGAAPVTEANLKATIAAVYVPHEGQAGLAERTIEPRTVDQLFDPLTVPKDWWEDEHHQVAAQYTEIRAVLADKLVDVQVFRLGELQGNVLQGAIDVYVLGATADGDVVGMWTVSVET